jgi:ubiquinone/menaquinone biosynthesis C-methylase UbiE
MIWTAIDKAQNSQSYVTFLDVFDQLPQSGAYKGRTFQLMDVSLGDSVLDVGCGTGADVRALSAVVGASGRAVGIDNSETMIAQAKLRCVDQPRAEFYVRSVFELGFDDCTFDSVRADRVFQHLDDPLQALKETIRVTKPAGRVVISDPDWSTLEISSDDLDTSVVVATAICSAIPNHKMGRELEPLFRETVLEGIQQVSTTLELTAFAVANRILGIEVACSALTHNGVLSQERANRWLASLQARDEQGEFSARLTGFAVRGTKPVLAEAS